MAKTKARPKTATGVRGLYLKHGLYVYQPPQRDGFRPPRISLSTADLPEALKLVEEIKRRKFEKAATDPLKDLIAKHLVSKAATGEHRSQHSTNAAKTGLKRFGAFFKVPAAQIRAADILRWKESMLAERKHDSEGKPTADPALSRASVASYMRDAQSFMSWLRDRGHILRSPFEDLPEALISPRDSNPEGSILHEGTTGSAHRELQRSRSQGSVDDRIFYRNAES